MGRFPLNADSQNGPKRWWIGRLGSCLIAVVAASSCGSFGIPPADSGDYLDVWNQSDQGLVLQVGDPQTGFCLSLSPSTLGNIYQDFGQKDRRIQLYAQSGEPLMVFPTRQDTELFVLADSSDLKRYEVATKLSEDGHVVYDMPVLPGIDGRPLADRLPRTADICGPYQ